MYTSLTHWAGAFLLRVVAAHLNGMRDAKLGRQLLFHFDAEASEHIARVEAICRGERVSRRRSRTHNKTRAAVSRVLIMNPCTSRCAPSQAQGTRHDDVDQPLVGR